MRSRTRIFKLPLLGGQIAIVVDPGGQAENFPGGVEFHSSLKIRGFRNGVPTPIREFMRNPLLVRKGDMEFNAGSGLVTNVGGMALANDFGWFNGGGTLKLANQHFSGIGTTSPTQSDIHLQTISSNGGQTAVAGSQSLVSAGNSQKYQTVALISYTGTEAVTEWGLFNSSTYSATTGSPFTATTATSATVTGTPFTPNSSSVRGQTEYIVVDTTTGVWGLVTANTSGVLTVPAWYKITDGTAGSTPGATDAFTLYPVMWDHKTFGAFNVNSGDALQFTYDLTVTTGG